MEAIDHDTREVAPRGPKFKLRGPAGEIREYEARDPENLKKAEVGDIVVITFTEAVAITVEKTE